MLNKSAYFSTHFFSVLCLTLVFFIVNYFKLNHASLYLDEAYSLFYTQQDYEGLSTIFEREANPTLYYLLLHYWGMIFGYTIASGRALSLIFMSVLLFISMKWLVKRYKLSTGILYGIMFISSSFLINYALEIRGFAFTSLCFFLSCIWLVQLKKSNKIIDALLFTLFTVLTIYGHLVSVFGIIVLFLFLVISRIDITYKLLPVVLFSLSAWPILNQMSAEKLESSSLWLLPPNPQTAWYELSYLFDHSLILWLVLFGALISVILLIQQTLKKQLDHFLLLFLSTCFGAWILCYIGSQFVPTFLAKYLVYTLPLFFLLLSISFSHLIKKVPKSSLFKWIVVGLFALVSIPRIGKSPIKGEDWKSVVSFAKLKQKEGYFTIVSPVYMYRPFAYYYDRAIFSNYTELFPTLYKEKIAFMQYLDSSFFEYSQPRKIMYIQSHEGQADPTHKSLHLLSKEFQFIEMVKFQGIKAYCFESNH